MKKILIVMLSFALLILVILSGCINTQVSIKINDQYYQTAPRDDFVFNHVALHQYILEINVSYGGGCEQHQFELIATSFMESYPVQVNVVLSHEDNDDPCDAWITELLSFSLLPLKKAYREQYLESSGTIKLNIEGLEEEITYEF